MLKSQDFPLRQLGNCLWIFFPQTFYLPRSLKRVFFFLVWKKKCFLPLCLSVFPFLILSGFYWSKVLSQKTEAPKCKNYMCQASWPNVPGRNDSWVKSPIFLRSETFKERRDKGDLRVRKADSAFQRSGNWGLGWKTTCSTVSSHIKMLSPQRKSPFQETSRILLNKKQHRHLRSSEEPFSTLKNISKLFSNVSKV